MHPKPTERTKKK